jgi:hypothetical protein
MGIRAKGNVKTRFRDLRKRLDEAIILRLSKVGEDLVNYARSIPPETGFSDQTGNLRSSIGYIIVYNGKVINKDFTSVSGHKPKPVDGKTIGENHALNLSKNHSSGYALIFVAGMEYAYAVESRGRDVLTTTEYQANEKLPKELEKLKQQIKRMKL